MNDNQQIAARLTLARKADGWWITGGELDMGPYATKADASEDREGVRRFLRHAHRRHYVTVCGGTR